MAHDYEETFRDRSEYGAERGEQYRTPSGAARALSVAERARLARSAGIADGEPRATEPNEYGIRVG